MPSSDDPQTLPLPVRRAMERAAADAGEAAAAVRLLGYEPVTWPDAALGAPEPGRLYAQLVTPGYRVRLAVAGRPVEYHTDLGERVVAAR